MGNVLGNIQFLLNLKSLLVQKLFHPFQSMFEGHVGLQPCNISFIKTPQANPPFELNLLSLTISPYPQWSQTVEPEAWAQWIPLRRMPRELFLSFRGTRQCGAEFWSASVSAQLRRRSCDVATDQYIEGTRKIGWFHTISYRHQDWDFFLGFQLWTHSDIVSL